MDLVVWADELSFHVSYFRQEWEMKEAVPRAHIHCAADSRYRLWINGQYIGFGPARGRTDHPYYDTHVVPLKAGRNTIAFLCSTTQRRTAYLHR